MLLGLVALVVILVGAVVAIAKANGWWTVVLAVTALLIAAAGVAAGVVVMLREQEALPFVPGRRAVMTSVAVAAFAVVLAVAVADGDSAATSTTQPTAAAAAETVRDFVASAVLDDNAYAACMYLTPSAQQGIARLAGAGQTCRDALTATDPSLAGIQSERALQALRLHAAVRDGTASVTATPNGRRPVTFVLRRTTASEAAAYQAPSGAWRIADGATAFGSLEARTRRWRLRIDERVGPPPAGCARGIGGARASGKAPGRRHRPGGRGPGTEKRPGRRPSRAGSGDVPPSLDQSGEERDQRLDHQTGSIARRLLVYEQPASPRSFLDPRTRVIERSGVEARRAPAERDQAAARRMGVTGGRETGRRPARSPPGRTRPV